MEQALERMTNPMPLIPKDYPINELDEATTILQQEFADRFRIAGFNIECTSCGAQHTVSYKEGILRIVDDFDKKVCGQCNFAISMTQLRLPMDERDNRAMKRALHDKVKLRRETLLLRQEHLIQNICPDCCDARLEWAMVTRGKRREARGKCPKCHESYSLYCVGIIDPLRMNE